MNKPLIIKKSSECPCCGDGQLILRGEIIICRDCREKFTFNFELYPIENKN